MNYMYTHKVFKNKQKLSFLLSNKLQLNSKRFKIRRTKSHLIWSLKTKTWEIFLTIWDFFFLSFKHLISNECSPLNEFYFILLLFILLPVYIQNVLINALELFQVNIHYKLFFFHDIIFDCNTYVCIRSKHSDNVSEHQ